MEHPSIRGLSGWVPLARGGFTLVWEARQELLSRPVAVKVYRPGLAEGIYETFTREADISGRLSDHPGVVTVYDAGLLPDARPYLIMELCSGGSLTRWLDRKNVRTEEQIRQVGVRVADTLAGLHARGVIHRDVKPANILIDGSGSPRLADFGLATLVGAEAAATDALRLTPAYAPPEAFLAPLATESGDVFSLAATLYALLAGHPPRWPDAGDLRSTAEAGEAPINPLPGVNWFFMDALLAGLSADSADRPSAAEFRDRLSTVPGSEPRRSRWPRTRGNGQSSLQRPRLPLRLGHQAITARPEVARSLPPVASARGDSRPASYAHREPQRVGILATAAAVVLLATSGTAWLIAEPVSSNAPTVTARTGEPSVQPSEVRPSPIATPTINTAVPAGSDRDVEGSAELVPSIQVTSAAATAEPFETVRLRGIYGGQGGTMLQIQLRVGGAWQTFPVPAKTSTSGEFTAYVELSRPDSYRLRVRDPRSGVTSAPFSLVIEGAG